MRTGAACVLVVMSLNAEAASGEDVDHVLFDFPGSDTPDAWHLNIYGTNAEGVKKGGSGKTEPVAGKHPGQTALRFSSQDAGSYNFISPDIPDGNWRNRHYYGAEIRYRGDGTAGSMQIYAVTFDGKYAITLRFDGTRTWKTEIHRSGWSRPGTPPLDWSKIDKLYVHGSGTQSVDIERITLVGGVKRVHLEEEPPLDGPGVPTSAPRADARIGVSQTGLFKLDHDGPRYNFRLRLEKSFFAPRTEKSFFAPRKNESTRSRSERRLSAELKLAAPGESPKVVATSEILLGTAPETDADLPFEYTQTRDGRHRLELVVRDAEGRAAAAEHFEFLLMRPREFNYQELVLWPQPHVWEPGEQRWILPETITLATTGDGDSFPAEHLAEKLNGRYGVRVVESDKSAANVRLRYVEDGVEPEGFELDVDASGVRLQASSPRGMYYAVRALLDIARQSSFARSQAGILHTHCEDWPDVPMRVYTDFFISERYHQTPLAVGAFKKHVYDQIAGGRYNLYAMQISEHVRYDSHPELAPSNRFSKDELKEIIDFARRHYVDVAPGWNTPGHCAWLVAHAHPDLQEDGNRRTLCTSNPKGMRILKDIAQELLDLFEPSYFHMGGDEVTHGWNRIAERTCPLCAGKPRNQLLLEHWSELARFFQRRNVRPILFDDMLSVRWNGGAPYHCADILPELPRNLIICTWGASPLSVPPEKLKKLGFAPPWWVSTSFSPAKMDSFPAMWRDYHGCGVSETTTWVWSNFTHSDKQCYYSTPALHANAACCWNAAVATIGQPGLIRSDGVHWSNVMRVPDWGTRALSYRPISIAAAANDSTRDAKAGDGQGWMDLGPQRDLRGLPTGDMSIGGIPFDRPQAENDCILLDGEEVSRPVEVGRKVLGFAFAQTAGANEAQTESLQRRFFRKNTDPLALPVAHYRVRYADGTSASVPVRLGYDVHLWDCDAPARVMPGPSTYWMGQTGAQKQKDPGALDACVWVMEWKNPRPAVAVTDVTLMAAGTEATVALLGVTAVQ